MVKIYLAILFIAMTTFIINGTVTDFTGYDFDESADNVKAYTEQGEALFEAGFVTLFLTAETLVNTIDNITSFWLEFTSSSPFFGTTPEEAVELVCTPYSELNFIQQTVYITRTAIFNLFNENLTVEQFYALDRGLEFGVDWNQECS